MDKLRGPTSHNYVSQRLRLHYVDWGNPDAPPLLLVHGGRDHCRNWDWVAQQLCDDYHIIAPDLRGHGDSQWMIGGTYSMNDYIYDIAQLVHQMKLAPVRIVAHSLGGNICLRFAGLYPQSVSHIVAIEGLGPSPDLQAKYAARPLHDHIAQWVDQVRSLSARLPRRYPSLEDAYQRMHQENPHLSPAQARHLTIHGVNQNEDGTYSWKFDNYVRVFPVNGQHHVDASALWQRIQCPTLLIRGCESWASDPLLDGRGEHFRHATMINVEQAGHWVHHDQLAEFMAHVRPFLQQ